MITWNKLVKIAIDKGYMYLGTPDHGRDTDIKNEQLVNDHYIFCRDGYFSTRIKAKHDDYFRYEPCKEKVDYEYMLERIEQDK